MGKSARDRTQVPRPLEGVTVVSIEQAIAAPFATRQLADLGARVIKLERPEGGDFARHYDERVHGLSSHFVWTNRSKESVTLNLKAEPAGEVIERLLRTADIFIQNLAPGAVARLGLDYSTLNRRFPQLIACDISGYGSDGPYRDKKAYDLLIQSESGFLSVTGEDDRPAKAGCSIADIAAGMYAFSRILAALCLRNRTGEGSRIEVSMLESMVEWMGYPLYYSYDGAAPPPRAGAAHATIYPYGPFPAGDGKTIMLGLQNDREWKVFCRDVLKRPDLLEDERFSRNSGRSVEREVLREIITNAFQELDSKEVLERLDGAGIANASLNDMHDVWEHPQLRARGVWTEVDTPAGPIPALYPPGGTDAYQAYMGAVPALGEHTESVLSELGFSATEIQDLHDAKVI